MPHTDTPMNTKKNTFLVQEIQFWEPTLVLQVTNAGVRRPWYEASYITH